MGHRRAAEGHNVLVAAPYGRDADSVVRLLREQGYEACACGDLDAVAEAIDEHVGVVIVTQEALRADTARLRDVIAGQPAWSDLPFILLTSAQHRNRRTEYEHVRARLLDFTSNAVVLERPLSLASLISATTSAMRARQKQFEMRDRVAQLADSEGRLRLATAAAAIGTWDYDTDAQIVYYDDRSRAIFGLEDAAPVTFQDGFVALLHPDDRAATLAAVEAAIAPGSDGSYSVEYRVIRRNDGVEAWIAASGRVLREGDGRLRFVGTLIDASAHKHALAALAASEAALRRESQALDRANRTLEEQVAARTAELEAEMVSRTAAEAALRQSQKMEAVGQLTGGIAHDFNNMLTGVIGALDIMKRRIAGGRLDDLDRFMDAATVSAQRAAGLTARLLAFSRRQSLDLKPLDANALIASLEELLRRTIREDVALTIATDPALPAAVADSNQLENAILNLAINARDAMPDGGQLTIETRVVALGPDDLAAGTEMKPGRYVVVAVTDTGVGMAPDVLEKVFDPFFTTKPIGQGTGLGLSMVYGFAQQSGGQVRVHSQPGVGTTVSIYLVAGDGPVAADTATTAAAPAPEGAGQTVLLVEDDPAVRLLVREVLAELHYTTIEADEATAAIPVLESARAIDLMISDVGLPGMNGRQLAEIARQHRPDLPILFVTGYAENAAIRAGFLGTNMAMITKPFALDALAGKISEMVPRHEDA